MLYFISLFLWVYQLYLEFKSSQNVLYSRNIKVLCPQQFCTFEVVICFVNSMRSLRLEWSSGSLEKERPQTHSDNTQVYTNYNSGKNYSLNYVIPSLVALWSRFVRPCRLESGGGGWPLHISHNLVDNPWASSW